MIIWPADVSVPDVHFREIWERDIPLVTIDRETTTHADHVGTDEEKGGRLAAEHLLSLGHRRILHATYPNRTGSIAARRAAFIKAVNDAGGTVEVVEAEQAELIPVIRDALAKPDRATAAFAATDPIAMKAYGAAADLGLRVPE